MDLLVLIAKAADVCRKPWSHAVVPIDPSAPAQLDDLNVRIECRDAVGIRVEGGAEARAGGAAVNTGAPVAAAAAAT